MHIRQAKVKCFKIGNLFQIIIIIINMKKINSFQIINNYNNKKQYNNKNCNPKQQKLLL